MSKRGEGKKERKKEEKRGTIYNPPYERAAHGWHILGRRRPNEGEFSPRFASTTLVVVQSFVILAGRPKGVSLISEFHSDDSPENVGDAKLLMATRKKMLQHSEKHMARIEDKTVKGTPFVANALQVPRSFGIKEARSVAVGV